jgi:mevalonate kinase
MGFIIGEVLNALDRSDWVTLGRLMNIHQLLQEKMGTSCPESDRLIEAAIAGGALGAKISGSGCGGIVIALAELGEEDKVAKAMESSGGKSYVTRSGAAGVHLVTAPAQEEASSKP